MRLCSDQPHAEAVCTLASLRQHAAKAGRAHADRPRGAAPADDAPRGGDEALGLPPKLLYVTPERLVTSLQLQRALADLRVVGLLQRVVVDEVILPLPRVTHSHPRGHRPALCAYPMNDPRGRTRQAHCVVLWGGDFRPEYSRLGELRERLGVPWLMLTATLPPAMRVQASLLARPANEGGPCAAALLPTLTPVHARAAVCEPED